MEIKIKRLHPDAVIPSKGTPGSACYDVYAPCDFEVLEGRNIMPLGWAIELPQGYAAEIRPRSGYSSKGFTGTRGVKEYEFDADVLHGCIDADYRKEIGVMIISREMLSFVIRKGQRVAQMLIIRAEEADFSKADELTPTQRDGGFGSTGT